MGLLSKKQTDEDVDFSTDFTFPTSTQALIIFTRNPELGKCKTRLAKTVGDESALRIYKFLLEHTAASTQKLKADKFVFYTENIRANDIWDDNRFTKRLQEGEDLGEKMQNAFTALFNSGYKKVMIVGSDLYDLKQQDIEEAFSRLDTNDYVIGPAKDGGYYLLGMKTINTAVFNNKDWSTASVFEDTLKDLDGEKVALLEKRNDIDHYEDIENIPVFEQFLPKKLQKTSSDQPQ
ncbi:MAG: TIGR04282 family arsenosugar biosynthesis glycosyltransferase [Leeuwenhoekiella sp.]